MKARLLGREFFGNSRQNIVGAVMVLVGLLAAPFAGAQSTGGRIRGTVTDESGGAVAGANITLINEATHATRDVQSGANGEYVFLEVPVGTYEIDTVSQGFKKSTRKGIVLNLNEVISVDLTLQIGGATETVEVTGAPPVVDTTSTQLGAVVNERSTTQLPLNKRDPFQLLQLQPGVQSQIGNDLFFGSDKAGVVTVNGGRGRSNNYSVNGGDSNDQFANLPAVQPSPDSIEEFRVLSNNFDAEYGRNSGSVINVVTKSGTNKFHGSVYEFFRNDVLNAHGFTLNPTPKAPFKQNQFGGTFGGPLKRDKTFFFGAYEGRRIVQGIVSQQVPVPTIAELAGRFTGAPGATSVFQGSLSSATVATILQNRCGSASLGGSKLTPAGQAALDQAAAGASKAWNAIFPATTAGGGPPVSTIPTQCFDPVALSLLQYIPGAQNSTSGQTQNVSKQTEFGNQAQFRLDHNFSNNQKTSVYYYYDNSTTLDPFAHFQAAGGLLGNFPGEIVLRAQQLNISHSSTIGSTAVNEFRFNFFREAEPKFYTPTRTNLVTASCGSGVASAFCFTGTSDTPLLLADGSTTTTPACQGFGCGIHPNLGAKLEGVPEVNFNTGTVLFGNNFEGQLPQTGNTFQFTDNYSKIIGNHSFKFGGDIRYQMFDQSVYFNVNGDITFTTGGLNDLNAMTSNPSNPAGSSNLYPDYLLGLPNSYSQGSGNTERVRSKALYLFAQDSWKLRPNLTLNYGLRWELNTPQVDTGKKVQVFRPGQDTTIYPCQLSAASQAHFAPFLPAGTTPDCINTGVLPTGLVVPGDKGVPAGLFNTDYKAFAPRLGLNWSPDWRDGALAKLTGGPGRTSISMGWGLFYNPIEQLVLEQFVAEPPFGISNSISNPLLSTPFVDQLGSLHPNPANGILSPPRGTPQDWSLFRGAVLFGDFPSKLRTQYSAQYNLTIKRQLPGNILFQIGYVGSQGHRLLAIHDVNAANSQTCLDLAALAALPPQPGLPSACGPFAEDQAYTFTLPAGSVFHLPYAPGGPNGQNIPCPFVAAPAACMVTGAAGGTPITLVGIRPYSSPHCNPLTGAGCPVDSSPVFSSIFAEDSVAYSNYNSLQALFEKQYTHGLQFQAAYTFSKSLDNASSFEEILNARNFRSTYGPSLFDARHRFVFNAVWDLPVPKMEGFKGKLLNGWQVSGIYTYQTGFPIRITSGSDNELQGSTSGFITPGEPNLLGKFVTHDPRKNVPGLGTGYVFDPTLFSNAVTPGQIGSSPRTLCCNPPINNWDAGFFKDTHFGEGLNVEFRAEVYNVLNHAQFYSTDGNVADSTFGQFLKVRDPRLLQFGLKFIF
ncbi:MAG TPA: TonB-dependent receptor [Candidatus Dormibacteraeota bacterium]|nr:TonB-dependent receptor [Candidatus Dormibacteraeota bacterium]